MARLDAEIDRLYGLPLDEFTGARNELAKRLAKDGDTDAAAEMGALKKPTLAAWTVNQLARQRRADVDQLLAAGRALRKAHRAALGGSGGDALAEAARDERAAVSAVVEAARDLLDDAGRPATQQTLDKIGSTIHAAALDLEVGKALEAGRLTEEVEPAGFGPLLTAVPSSPAAETPRRSEPKKPRAEDTRRALREAQRALREAKEVERRRSRDANEAEREAEKKRGEAKRAAERAVAARSEADEAHERVAALERDVAAAKGKSR